VGNRTKLVESLRKPDETMINATINYTYHNLYQLTDEVRTGDLAYEQHFTYDAVGNRTRLVKFKSGYIGTHDIIYTYNAGDHLTQSSDYGMLTSYSYDFDGNLVAKSTGSESSSYEYAPSGILEQAHTSAGQTCFLSAGPQGRCVCREIGEDLVRYVRDPAGFLTCNYVSGNYEWTLFHSGELIAWGDGSATGKFYLEDASRSVRIEISTASSISRCCTYSTLSTPLIG